MMDQQEINMDQREQLALDAAYVSLTTARRHLAEKSAAHKVIEQELRDAKEGVRTREEAFMAVINRIMEAAR